MLTEMKLLWKDRKRICGLPITFTKYSLSEDRLFVEAGLLNIKQEELLLYRIQDISLKLSLGQRIFGVGSVLVQSSDRSTPVLEVKNIRQPRQVKELIHQQFWRDRNRWTWNLWRKLEAWKSLFRFPLAFWKRMC